MKVEVTARGGGKITVDVEGLKALGELLAEVGEQGHGCQSDGSLPEVVLVDEVGKVMLPARKAKQIVFANGSTVEAADNGSKEVMVGRPVVLTNGMETRPASELGDALARVHEPVQASPGLVLKSVDVGKVKSPKAPVDAKVG